MNHLVYVALLAFGIGYYVGKPTKVVVQAEGLRDCTILQTVYSSDAPTSSVQRSTPKPSATPDSTPEPSATPEEAKTESSKPEDKEAFNADEWVKDVIKESATWMGKYDMGDQKITLNAEKYAALDKLRAALQAANFRITEEGPMKLGDYIYYIKISTND